MEIKLLKDWKRRNGVIKKGKSLEVDLATAKDLISKRVARPVRENFLTKLVNKGVDEGTKQTAKYKKKEKEVNGNNGEI